MPGSPRVKRVLTSAQKYAKVCSMGTSYQRWIRGLPSVVSGRTPCEAAHVKTRGSGGALLGNLVPLTTIEHRRLHAMGLEEFERRHACDLALAARALLKVWRAML